MLKDRLRSMCQWVLGSLFNIKRVQWGGGHEKEFLYFLDMIPKEEGIILDIGANIGVMTVTMALSHKNATVFSFEPIPDNVLALEKVVKFFKLKNVRLIKTALGDEPGEIKMVVPVVGNSNMQGLSHVVESGETDAGKFFSVPVQKLDDMPELKSGLRIMAIKIDVENFEYYVLKGARELLLKNKPIIYCELWDNERRVLCMNYMKELGYKVKIFIKGVLTDFHSQEGINFFFVPASN
jgi:FkbM family methyltransferase